MTVLHEEDTLVMEPEQSSRPKEKILIDEKVLEDKGFVSINLSEQRNSLNAEFRAIKHEIITNAFTTDEKERRLNNLVMITSAFPNEGKTFCAINLALMLSLEKNKSVLLVDADVLRPCIYKMMNLRNKSGLIDYLSDNIKDVDEVIYETSIPNLKILPAGEVHSLSYELLASNKMLDLIEFLMQKYSDSIVVFDGPPVLGVIETVSLSKLVGQVVIVAEHNKTQISDIKDVMLKLHRNLFTGVIINKSVSKSIGKYGYGYYKY